MRFRKELVFVNFSFGKFCEKRLVECENR